ncbi:redoxin domain-containing protein [Phenylobacterium sp.]|uniref:monooxygenase n=1 Tax=Phenylobacterium sp. TaxID=1871053 RepID=UPI0025E3ABEB|nr:redoxin domain-containing protein [Phenylobacterium sp.]
MITMKTMRRAGLAALLAATALAAGSLTTIAGAQAPAALQVDDFRLSDQNYLSRQLYRMSDAKAVVLIAYASGDKTVKTEAASYEALRQAYGAKGVETMLLASKLGETRERVNPEAKALGLSMPILFDYQQLVGEQLGVTRAGETIVVDPRTWTVAYRGPVEGARETLDGLVAGRKAPPVIRVASGAPIAFPERGKAHDKISYVKDIAPIIQAKCTGCHQPGGVGPMPLNTYDQVRGFSPMIREVLRTKRMPPFLADETVGAFQHDERLNSEQIKTLVHWVEAGAPRGKGEDPLAKIKFQAPEWPLGKPDAIVTIPAVKIPAQGVLDYSRPVVANPMPEGRWMKATTFKVTDRQVVHHILTGVVGGDVKPGQTASEAEWGASLGGYGPGRGSNLQPKDTGVWVPPSGGVAFQNHYTPYGRETTEETQMGIYFYPKGQEPKYVLRTFGIFDFSIVIPPGAEYHHEQAYIDVPKEMILYGLTPHAHHRGGSVSVAVKYPNGKEEMLLAMPRYDFNWQYEYFLETPLKVPAGSKVITRWTFDNSTRNPANPDPKREIRWGEQSSEEMLALYLHYRWTDETVARQKPENDKLMQAGLMIGVMDDDMDGRLTRAELKGNMGENLQKYFALIDANKDGGVDRKELDAAMKMMPRRRNGGQAAADAPAAAGAPGGR